MRPRSRPVSVQPAPDIFAALPSLDDKTPLVAVEEMEDVLISLPLNLEELTLERFDQLVESGELFYHPSLAELVEHNGFKVWLTRHVNFSYLDVLKDEQSPC